MPPKDPLDTTEWSTPIEAEPSPELDALIAKLTRTETARSEAGQVIARGGMGQVEEYLDHGLQRRAARKVLPSGRRHDPQSVRLFIREAQITSYLDHPSIVPVHNIALKDDQLQFSMKLVEGQTLSERIAAAGAPTPGRTDLYELLQVIVRVCDALALAHSRGVIHCDVKPENIMTGRFGEVYLMDWGVARFLPGSARERPEQWAFVDPAFGEGVAGTLAYMAPEQARGDGESISRQTDIFGLGATLYEVLTGKAPYHGLSYSLARSRAIRGQFPSASDTASGREIPSALLTIVDRAMAPEIEDRYADIGILKASLVAFLRGETAFPTIEFAAGEVIVSEGQSGDCAYIIEDGYCSVFKVIEGERILLREMGPGEIFGETAVLSPGPRTASIVADTDLRAQLVTGDALLGEVQAMRPWMGRIIRTLADRYRETQGPDQAPPAATIQSSADLALRLVMLASTYGKRTEDELIVECSCLPASLRGALEANPAHLRQQLSRYAQIEIDLRAQHIRISDWRQLADRLRERS